MSKERLEELKNAIAHELGLTDDWMDGTYLYQLTRAKSAFSVGTMTLDDFEEIDGELLEDIFNAIKPFVIEKAERVQELEREFELFDIIHHKLGMTVNNPNASDDEKWEEVNKLLAEAWESDCIHCNGKGFNGLNYCPSCVRGKVIKENLKLEQQNKRYREAFKQIKLQILFDGAIEDHRKNIIEIIDEALEGEELK